MEELRVKVFHSSIAALGQNLNCFPKNIIDKDTL